MTTHPTPGNLPTIPDVTLHGELARGGMGIVYRGRQDFLERDVAVKVLAPELQGERFAARFRREAKLLASIKDPHIVACHAAGVTTAGQHYLVMELVEGPTLEQWIAQHGRVPVHSAVRIVSELAKALGHAHELGVIHRDIKPANVILEAPSGTAIDPHFPFEPKLVDLGLARLIAADADLAQTAPGSVMGTPATMAPEQFDAPDQVDFRADIYGLGCVLYEMLTGAPAYASQRLTDLVVQKRQPRGPDPCLRGKEVPAPLGRLVAAMLAQEPKDRPADYRVLQSQLEDAAKAPPTPASAKAKPGPNLLQTAEFAFLAEGSAPAPAEGAAAFQSRIVEPAPPRAPVAKPRPVPAAGPMRVVGPRASRRPLRAWLATGAVVGVLGLAAVPFVRKPRIAEPERPASAAPAKPAPAPRHLPEVEVLGLEDVLPRGKSVLLCSRASDADGDPLHYEWTVKPDGAAVLSSPTEATTAMRHDLLPGDEFTLALAVRDSHDRAVVERPVVVRYEPTNLLANFLAADTGWQPALRIRSPWRQREDGVVIATADDLPAVRTRTLGGQVWRIGGTLAPERAEARRSGKEGYAQSGVWLRVAPQRQLALLCTREGNSGERWIWSVQQVVHEEGRVGFALRPLPEATKVGVSAPGATGATFTVTRRGAEVRIQLGFAGRKEHTEHVETLREAGSELPLGLFARGGRVLFQELSLW